MSATRFVQVISHRWRQHQLDLLFIICLGLAAWRLTWSLEAFVDIGLHDETSYLLKGILLLEDGLPGAQWGPLYCLWYWGLHMFQSDPVQLYYLNYRVLALLTPVLIYLTTRRLCEKQLLALLPALIYLVSPAPHIWPRVSHFALLVILVCLIAAAGCRRPLIAQSLLALGFLLGSFCRPELFVPFIAAAAWVIIQLFRALRDPSPGTKGQLWAAGSFICGFTILVLWVGNPLREGTDANRSLLAFAQHYTLNHYRRANNPENPWTTANTVMQSHFGNAQSLSQAIANNPREFLRHTWDNLRHLPGAEVRLFLVSWSELIGARANTLLRRLEFTGLLAVAAWALVAISRKHAGWRDFMGQSKHRTLVLATVLSLLATIPSAAIIWPRDHYLLVSGVLGLCLGLCLVAEGLAGAWRKEQNTLPVLLAVALVLITPDYYRGWQTIFPGQNEGITGAARPTLPNLKTVKFIQSLPVKGPVTLLEIEGGYHAYLGANYSWVPAYEKNEEESFSDFVRRRAVNMVVLTDNLAGDVRFKNDAAFWQFIHQPEAYGFEALPVIGRNASVLMNHHRQD